MSPETTREQLQAVAAKFSHQKDKDISLTPLYTAIIDMLVDGKTIRDPEDLETIVRCIYPDMSDRGKIGIFVSYAGQFLDECRTNNLLTFSERTKGEDAKEEE